MATENRLLVDLFCSWRSSRSFFDQTQLISQMNECLFCDIDPDRVIASNDLAYAIKDGFPVTEGHTLVIPKRHAKDYFEMTGDESKSCTDLLHLLKERLLAQDQSITGFNIGMNAGESAGQTIFHSHIHLIPRRNGDVDEPRGGVRHTIPGKGSY